MDIHQRLKDNIDLLMERRRIRNYDALAVKANVAPNTVHSAAKGRYSTSLSSLTRIARALGVDTWQLLAPTAMLDDALASEAGQLIDDYRRSDVSGRETILKVAEAQAQYAARGSSRPDDQSRD